MKQQNDEKPLKRCYQCGQGFTPAKVGDWCCADCLEDYRASKGKEKPFIPGKTCYRCRQDFTPEKPGDWCCANCLHNYHTHKYISAMRELIQYPDNVVLRGKLLPPVKA